MIIEPLLMVVAAAITAPSHTNLVNYGALVEQAMTCKHVKDPATIDVELLWKLVEVESQYNPAPEVRGMILAAACSESGYNPNAQGDRKFSRDKRTPMALGILQQWKIYEKLYGTNRFDPISAAHGWMKHIVRMVPKVKKCCRYKTPKKIWVAAWVTGIRYKKPGGRCKETPRHYRLLKRWQRDIKKEREEYLPKSNESLDGDGC